MKGRTTSLLCWMLLFVLYPALSAASEPQACSPEQLKVITTPGSSIQTLSKQQLLTIFTMKRTFWSDGSPIHVFVLPSNSSLHQQFSEQYLSMFPYQLSRIWYRQVFSGAGQAPTRVKTGSDMLQKVATTPGAIGYACLTTPRMAEEVDHVTID
ncbi:type 2 periplasmic-binding domain-containing protein [Dongshaea marina]|uniref:hypothetical protein n=1 Tax=Dongshaea marina TaxID=2047966 RepID=UPI0018FFB7A3|nr:hypothetical protein [Dongshaea marina]